VGHVALALEGPGIQSALRQQEWNWEFVGKPLGDSAVNGIYIHPMNDTLWYVTSYVGLYITSNGGKNWAKYLSGNTRGFAFDPHNPARLFCSSNAQLYRSEDYGASWQPLKNFQKYIISVLVSARDSAVYVGITWEETPTANGIYKSTDRGQNWSFYPYSDSSRGLIPWDIEEDESSGVLYVGTEIYNHPSPYHPPFFRSSDGGETWTNVSSKIPWHVIRVQVDTSTHTAYVLTEGAGLYKSTDGGISWNWISRYFGLELLLNRLNPHQLFGGDQVYGNSKGGVFFSTNSGVTFENIGLLGKIVASLALNGSSTQLYAACYNSGLYRARVLSTKVEQDKFLPSQIVLYQNYPNPFNPSTTISFYLPSKSFVTLKVFDALGREVSTILSKELSTGHHTRQWNANGSPSGVFFYRLQTGSYNETKKLVLLR
jgi:photosystem II stability/assembly factor-like uncharacterized protein